MLEERGFRDKGSALEYLDLTIQDYFGNPAAQIWWQHHRAGYPQDFAAAIDGALVNVDLGANYRKLMAIQNELQKLAEENVAP